MAPAPSSSKENPIMVTYGYMLLWICLSANVILINKYILSHSGFPFPIALTLSHMAFCSVLAFGIVNFGFVDSGHLDRSTYIRCVVPIAALFAGTLWMGNAAYLYLSVSFIQMVKASMPVTVFIVGCMLGTEKYQFYYALNIVVVGFGIALASFGEIDFVLIGFLLQIGSILTESVRLSLIQILLQGKGIKLNPVTTLYYVAPACFLCLMPAFAVVELPVMLNSTDWTLPPGWLLGSCISAFALNMAVFLLIGRSSALTMNIAGVVKDWLLILLSVVLFNSQVSQLQLVGYGIAFAGVAYYNYQKMHNSGIKSSPPPLPTHDEEDNKTPLLMVKTEK